MSKTKRESERVIELLKDPEAFPDGAPALYGYVIGTHMKHELSYEQWVHPMKMTGGKIALHWTHSEIDTGGYIWYTPSGLVYTFESAGQVYTGRSAVNCMKETISSDEKVTVVLKENMNTDIEHR